MTRSSCSSSRRLLEQGQLRWPGAHLLRSLLRFLPHAAWALLLQISSVTVACQWRPSLLQQQQQQRLMGLLQPLHPSLQLCL